MLWGKAITCPLENSYTDTAPLHRGEEFGCSVVGKIGVCCPGAQTTRSNERTDFVDEDCWKFDAQ